MERHFLLKILTLLLFSIFLGSNITTAKSGKSVKKDMHKSAGEEANLGNLYTTWVKLALLGKNQAEIEFFFRGVREKNLMEVKDRLRSAVIDNLRRSGLSTMIQKSTDVDDFNTIVRKIITEIRYLGMEHDTDLKLTIKEEFGVILERL